MRKIIFIVFLAIGTNAFGQPIQKTAKSPIEFIPSGYFVFKEIKGDLNKDNQEDYVFIIKGTDKDKFVKDEYQGQLDRNRRGIIIVFKNQNHYELALENRDCFSSENEDGGVYYAPELSIDISKGNLHFYYEHGRYGHWSYSFRYQNSDFELIGYDSSYNRGPIVNRLVSINFITKKMEISENINPDEKVEDEEFEVKWKKFALSKPIKLREIVNFDNLEIESLLEPVK
ncbi:MAG: hypothetical protein LBE22_04675 [Azoarcus sp.]|jgi:hypothetical protein|nr:hypothetical protein [Azoarcus sp.]